MKNEKKLIIPQAPDFLFKQTGQLNLLVNEKQPIYLIEKMEAVQHTGMLIYYKNVPYPKKGFPSPEAIFAINQVKKIILEDLKLCKNPFFLLGILTTNKTNLLRSFNNKFNKIFFDLKTNRSFSLEEEWMCRSAFNFANFVHRVLIGFKVEHNTAKEFSFNVAQILEYDDAYRYRFQDVASELNVDLFKKNPRKELKRLITLFSERTTDRVVSEKLVYLFNFILFFTRFMKKHLVNSVSFLKQCERDQSDWYWSCLRNDNYLYKGMSKEDCYKEFKERPVACEMKE